MTGVGGFHDGAVVDGSVIAGFFGAESVFTISPSSVVISNVMSGMVALNDDIVTATGADPGVQPAGRPGRSDVTLGAVPFVNGGLPMPLHVTRLMRARPVAPVTCR